MASRSTRKTWETAFLLSASMSSSYQQTFDQAQQIMKDLGAENVQLGDEAERAAQRQANAFQLAASAVLESGLTEALGQVKDAYLDIIETTMEFEYTMSAVEAISEAGAEDIAELEEKARTLGETTVFTAQQSSEAMTFMAQAGWDTIEMLEGMDGVISLAAASGTDLAETSSIVADTLAGFGMEADETNRLADVLAQTSANTNTNVSLLGDTFANAAAVAGALGFQIEDVSVMLGIMANAGVKGSRAGTTMRNIFNGLAKDITLTADAFGEVDFSMFDEEGNAKDLISVIRELRGYFDQMTDKEKYKNASDIAGLRGYNGLLAIINATDEQFEELYEDIQNADGAAKKMADTRLDNLKGDVTLLKSAFESLKITLGERFSPTLRVAVDDATSLVQKTSEFVENHPRIVEGIELITVAVGGATTALTIAAGVLKAIAAIKMVVDLMSGGALITMGIGAVVGIMGTLYLKLKAVREEASHMYDEQKELAEQYQIYAEKYWKTSEEWAQTVQNISGERDNILSLTDRLEELMGIQSKTEAQKQEILTIVELLNEAIPELALNYEKEADALSMTAEAIRDRARAEAYAEEIAEKEKQLKERYKAKKTLADKAQAADELYKQAKITYETEFKNYVETYGPYGESEEYTKEIVDSVPQVAAAKAFMEEASKALFEVYAEISTNERYIEGYSEEIAAYKAELEGQNDDREEETEGQKEIREKIQNIEEVLDALDEDDKDRAVFEKMLEEAKAELAYEEEAAGRGEIQDTLDEAGMDYNDLKAGMKNAMNGTSMTSEDVSDQYGGAYEEAEGAEAVVQNGDMNITVNVNVEGNMTEETLPEVERVAEEAAEKVITYLGRHGSQRTRLGYN